MTRDEILSASSSQLNQWIDETIMKDRKHYVGDWPNWSGNISAAWEVVEKINDLWWVNLELTGKSWFACNFWNYKTAIYSETVHFQTAPEAITKAALLAVLDQTSETAYDEGSE